MGSTQKMCISGDSRIRMSNGGTRRAAALRVGDTIRSGAGIGVIALVRPTGDREVVRLQSGVALTAEHPVYVGGVWCRARDLACPRHRRFHSPTYDFVMREQPNSSLAPSTSFRHALYVEDMLCSAQSARGAD